MLKTSGKKTVVFLGGVNSFLMGYCLAMRDKGFDVIYIVDSKEPLHRPENYFADIEYPYPSWIREVILPKKLMYFMGISSYFIRGLFKQANIDCSRVDMFFVSGLYVQALKYLPDGARKIIVSYGSDVDVLANVSSCEILAKNFANKFKIAKWLVYPVAFIIFRVLVLKQLRSLYDSDMLVTFPVGFSSYVDGLASKLIALGVKVVRRYDVNFDVFSSYTYKCIKERSEFVIVSPIRVSYRCSDDGKYIDNKGNDIIIKALSEFYNEFSGGHRQIRIVLTEKGADIEHAKLLCEKLGLLSVVEWIEHVDLHKLFDIVGGADVCIEQVGNHWMGAVGVYAFALGTPVVTNLNKIGSLFSGNSSDLNIYNGYDTATIKEALRIIYNNNIAPNSDPMSKAREIFSCESVAQKILDELMYD